MTLLEIIDIIGTIVIIAGIIFMAIGAFGLFKFNDFYPRLLIASKIDTVGLLTLLLGICIRNGFSFFSAKVLFIVIIILILNPMVAHVVASSAYEAGYQLEGTLFDDDTAPTDEEGFKQDDSEDNK